MPATSAVFYIWDLPVEVLLEIILHLEYSDFVNLTKVVEGLKWLSPKTETIKIPRSPKSDVKLGQIEVEVLLKEPVFNYYVDFKENFGHDFTCIYISNDDNPVNTYPPKSESGRRGVMECFLPGTTKSGDVLHVYAHYTGDKYSELEITFIYEKGPLFEIELFRKFFFQ